MRLTTNGKLIDTAPIARLLTQGERNADLIEIALPLSHGALNLTALHWTLAAVSDRDTRAEQPLPSRTEGDVLLAVWTVTELFTAVAGALSLELIGADAEGQVQIKYGSARPLVVRSAAGVYGLPTPDLAQQYLDTVRGLANEANSAAQSLVAAGIALRVLGYYPTLSALQAAVPAPAVGDLYGVGADPAIYAYIWTGTAWSKGQLLSGPAGAIPCTATYTPATRRHVLTPTQTDITLPEVFTVRFVTAAAFAAGDKVELDGVEYTPTYTDSAEAVAAGAWLLGVVVELTLERGTARGYVGAGKVGGKVDVTEAYRANLLINGDFGVNQRGQSSYTTGYTVDMWNQRASGAAVVLQSAGGVKINEPSSQDNYARLTQVFEQPQSLYGKTLTLSALVRGYYALYFSPDTDAYLKGYASDFEVVSTVVHVPTSGSPFVELRGFGATGAEYKWAKLEEGDRFTGVCPIHPSDELARCQRYQLIANREIKGIPITCGTNDIDFIVPIPTTMRTGPRLIGTYRVVSNGGGAIEGFAVGIVLLLENAIQIRFVKTAHGVNFSSLGFLGILPGGGFDANL